MFVPSSLYFRGLVNDQAEATCINTASTVVRKYLRLRSSGRLDFQITPVLFKAAQILAMVIFTSFSREFITLARYVNYST